MNTRAHAGFVQSLDFRGVLGKVPVQASVTQQAIMWYLWVSTHKCQNCTIEEDTTIYISIIVTHRPSSFQLMSR